MAPPNPDFLVWLARTNNPAQLAATNREQGLGWVPSPLNRSHLRGQRFNISGVRPLSYPAAYDLRTQGKLTTVRNQNPWGTCWTFATYGSMESCLLPGQTNDFSENHLANTHGFDWGYDDGGNADMSIAYLTRWDGPLNETDDPYPNPGGSPVGLSPRKHIQQALFVPSRISASDNDNIKQAIMTCGGVYINYYHDDTCYNSTYASYYYSGGNQNHAVVVVGWDDNFDKSKFRSTPAGNGAFLVRNSWGTSWGSSGYFYVSYYDTTFGYGEICIFSNAEATNNYCRAYSYDPLGAAGSIGYGSTNAWGANIFTASGNSEQLSAVGLYALSPNATCTLYVYTNVPAGTPRGGGLATVQTNNCANAGYWTLSLATPVPLVSGQRFSIVVKFTTPGENHPLPMEYAILGYSSAATSSSGQSYCSSAGSSWSDVTAVIDSTANVCIKGFASKAPSTLTVLSAHGGGTPGTVVIGYGSNTTQQITNSPVSGVGTQYVCVGAAVAGNAYTLVSATNVTLTLTNAATLTWLWSTNYWLQTAATNGTLAPTSSWVTANSNLQVVATPSNYYAFSAWSGATNGATIDSNRITVAMNMTRSLQAQFSVVLAASNVPQWWLAQYNQTNGGFNAAALLDPDGDGLPNWSEYVTGTDPTNAASTLAFTNSTAVSGGLMQYVWNTVTGRTYAVESCTNLAAALWTNTAGPFAGNDRALVWTNTPSGATQLFYRVRVTYP